MKQSLSMAGYWLLWG